uniref:PawS-like preproalbumin 1 n=1 Tax=Kingianthus paniculatus TaxID=244153 RepID=A0A076EA28_9ASTR|nr:PawS-like preproalbumin 1 [Kingianthus paniculatus]
MAKLALFALIFTAIVAFSAVSAYRTTITTTTIQDNGIIPVLDGLDNGIVPLIDGLDNGIVPLIDGLDNPQEQCRSQIAIEQLNHCQLHLTQGILKMVVDPRRPMQQQHLRQCCSQLKNVSPQCQCDAIEQVFNQARQQGGQRAIPQIASKAQRLPNDCGLEVQDCPLAVPRV